MTKRTRAAAESSLTPSEPDATSRSELDPTVTPDQTPTQPQDPTGGQAGQEEQPDERRPYEEWGVEFGVKSWELAAMRVRENWPLGQLVTREAFDKARKAARTEVIEQ